MPSKNIESLKLSFMSTAPQSRGKPTKQPPTHTIAGPILFLLANQSHKIPPLKPAKSPPNKLMNPLNIPNSFKNYG